MDTKLFPFFGKIDPLVCFEKLPYRVAAFTTYYGQFQLFDIQEKKIIGKYLRKPRRKYGKNKRKWDFLF